MTHVEMCNKLRTYFDRWLWKSELERIVSEYQQRFSIPWRPAPERTAEAYARCKNVIA
jgi:hypothetical protein